MGGESIFLVDVMPLLYRGYFAFLNKPRRTAAGVNTSPLFSFANTILQIREKWAPTHMALVFDSTTPTFRHEAYPRYKAQRDKLPEDIGAAIPMAREFAEALRIPALRVDGYEADDLLGSVSAAAVAAGMAAYLVSPDKDIAQLVGEGVSLVRLPTGGGAPEIWGVAEVCAHWGLASPAQMVDYLALAGDTSDNIPGVPGVGGKTAQKLLERHGSLEAILAAAKAGGVPGKLGEKLAAADEAARVSRFLTEIRRDVAVPVALEEMRVKEPSREAAAEFCARYELATVAKRLGLRAPDPALALPGGLRGQDGGDDVRGTLPCPAGHPSSEEEGLLGTTCGGNGEQAPVEVTDEAGLRAMEAELAKAPLFAFALEEAGGAGVTGATFAVEGKAWHVALAKQEPPALDLFGEPLDAAGAAAGAGLAAANLARVFALDMAKVAHGTKRQKALLRELGLEVAGRCHDTLLMHYVLDAAGRHDLATVAAGLAECGAATAGRADAATVLRVYSALGRRVAEAGLARALEESEEPLVDVLLDIEEAGVKVDAAALREFGRELAARIAELQGRVHEAAGTAFNLGSPKQLGEVLFGKLGIDPKAKKTASGGYATGEEVLLKYAPEHAIVRDILEWRAAEKMRSTYAEKLPGFISRRDGRIHTTLSQASTETGRLASSEPNLQNIPVRTEMGRRIRAAFVARDAGHLLVSADYSQVELRVMAALSGDEAMLAAFRGGRDIHAETAARVFGVAPEAVTARQRSQCKAVNFGIIYGMSAFGLAQRLEISRQEAASFIEEYFRHYPGVRRYMEKAVADARAKGYAETILGRRRTLPEINSRNGATRQAAERNAINTPVQGSAADLMKLAMVKVWRALKAEGLEARIILQIHDELLLDAPKGEEARVRSLLVREMAGALDLGVPLVVEVGAGPNWLAAH